MCALPVAEAQSLFRLERNQEAIADYVSPSNSKNAIALMKRGMIYEAIGESRLAAADYRRAAEHNPPFATTRILVIFTLQAARRR
ncbi:MAG: tetratricopeptide repeat protein [Phycisphaerae bacterium]